MFLKINIRASISEIFNESASDFTEYSSSTFFIIQRFFVIIVNK